MLIDIGGLTIGGRSNPLIITDFEDSGITYETSDLTIPNRPGVYAGKDRQSERTLTFTFNTGGGVKNLSSAQHLADELVRVWMDSASQKHGELTEMTIETRPDRRRRIMGRCRKITTVNPDVRAMQGSVSLLAEFVWTNPVAYEEHDERFSISVLPEQTGGLSAPLVAPLQAETWGGTGYRFVENHGDAPSAMSVTFHGPSKNPSLEVNNQVVALNKTLAYDESITVNGTTGTITNQYGDNMSRYLTSRTRLDALKLEPGSWEVAFRAEDDTNTARADIDFASAYRNY